MRHSTYIEILSRSKARNHDGNEDKNLVLERPACNRNSSLDPDARRFRLDLIAPLAILCTQCSLECENTLRIGRATQTEMRTLTILLQV